MMRIHELTTLVWSGFDASLSVGRVGIGMYRSVDTIGDQIWADWATLTPLVTGGAAGEVSQEQRSRNDAANARGEGHVDYSSPEP